MGELEGFLSELQADGEQSSETGTFSLSSEKAREKLKKFALQNPENYLLLLLAAMHCFGARRIDVRVDADDLEVLANCKLSRSQLKRMWTLISGGPHQGLRLMGLAILTSVRFQNAAWQISARDDQGPYHYTQLVSSGDLKDWTLEPASHNFDSLRVHVKRKSLLPVTGRYLKFLKNRLFSQMLVSDSESTQSGYEEERTLSERLFYDSFDRITLNEIALNRPQLAEPTFAILQGGNFPKIQQAQFEFKDKNSKDLIVLLARPHQELSNTITWIWHGLRMGVSPLKLPYDFVEVFYSADEMTTDLSLSGIPDTWERQRAERKARESVRELLHKLCLEFTKKQGQKALSVDPDLERLLLQVLEERIDISRSRRRLASFNRDLIACPLFLGSEEDGVMRRFTLSEIWERLEKSQEVALFRAGQENRPLPAWSGRPPALINHSGLAQNEVLLKLFGVGRFLNATQLLARIEELKENQPAPAEDNGDKPSGHIDTDWGRFEWHLDLASQAPGKLQVLCFGQLRFECFDEKLPAGFVYSTEANLERDPIGQLLDKKLVKALQRSALRELATQLEMSEELNTIALKISQRLWEAVAKQLDGIEPDSAILHLSWIVQLVKGKQLGLASLKGLLQAKPPLCVLDFERYMETTQESPAYLHSPIFLVPQSIRGLLDDKYPDRFFSYRGLELWQKREKFEFDEGEWWFYEEAPTEEGLQQIRLGIPLAEGQVPKGKARLETNLRGHALRTRNFSSFIAPLCLCLDWNEGWPDDRGAYFCDKDKHNFGREFVPEISLRAAMALFKTADVELFGKVPEEFMSSAWLELWTNEDTFDEPLFFQLDGSLISKNQLSAREAETPITDQFQNESPNENPLWVPPEILSQADLLGEGFRWTFCEDLQQYLPPKEDPDPPESSETIESKKSPTKIEEKAPPRVASSSTAPKIKSKAEPTTPFFALSLQIPDDLPSFTKLLLSELTQFEEPDTLTHLNGFFDFVSRLREEPQQENLVDWDVFGPSLRSIETLSAKEQAVPAILSALFSLYNRAEESVTDEDERDFHKRLLRAQINKVFG